MLQKFSYLITGSSFFFFFFANVWLWSHACIICFLFCSTCSLPNSHSLQSLLPSMIACELWQEGRKVTITSLPLIMDSWIFYVFAVSASSCFLPVSILPASPLLLLLALVSCLILCLLTLLLLFRCRIRESGLVHFGPCSGSWSGTWLWLVSWANSRNAQLLHHFGWKT